MARPSSRVLAPPGGASSDIFGTSPSYVPPAPATLSAQRAQQNLSSSVFAGPSGQQQAMPQQQMQQQPMQQQQQRPQQQQQGYTQQAAGGSASQSNMGGYGTYDINNKPSSRVLAPPGGSSSISFGSSAPVQQQPQATGLAAQRAAANNQSSVFGAPQQQQQQQYVQPVQQQVQPQQQQQYVQPVQQQQYVQPQQQQQQYAMPAAGGSASQANTGGYGTYDITAKPSSRVLAPPGGASSNIFGPAPVQTQQSPQGLAGQRQAANMSSSVFAGPTSPTATAQASYSSPPAAEQPTQPRSSTRVHAPPGGASQITFG